MNSRLLAVSPDNELDYQRQLAELDSLYRNSPNGVAVLDHDNVYVRVNNALAHFMALRRKDWPGIHRLNFCLMFLPSFLHT